MMRMTGLFIAVLLTATTLGYGGADPNAGTASFTFLKIGAGARPVALGGAYVGVAEGANGLYWNPGALSRIGGREFSATYMNYLVGMQSGYVAYVQPFGKRSSLGASVNYLNGGQVQETTLDNPTGVGLPKFSPGDIALEVAYGTALSPALSLGLGAKLIRETIQSYSAMGFALDLGAFYQPAIKGLTLGASLSNLGKRPRPSSATKNRFPWCSGPAWASAPRRSKTKSCWPWKSTSPRTTSSASISEESLESTNTSACARDTPQPAPTCGPGPIRIGWAGFRSGSGPITGITG